jgi:hypothetical protein
MQEPEIPGEIPLEVEAEIITPGEDRAETLQLEIVDLSDLPENSGAVENRLPKGRVPKPAKEEKEKVPPSGPPSVAEWQDFLGLTVLRMLTEGYLQLVLFRHIEESELTEREAAMIRLTREDLKEMAAPMASFANKNKTARKHGRAVIAAAGSYEAIIDLFIWMKRVNKIARAHRKDKPETEVNNGIVPTANVRANDGDDRPGGPIIFNRGTG